jgi:hypothetical protein
MVCFGLPVLNPEKSLFRAQIKAAHTLRADWWSRIASDQSQASRYPFRPAPESAGRTRCPTGPGGAGHTSPERSRRNPLERQRLDIKLRSAREKTRPTLHNGETGRDPLPRRIRQLKELIESNAIQVLNVAGPRESNESGNLFGLSVGCEGFYPGQLELRLQWPSGTARPRSESADRRRGNTTKVQYRDQDKFVNFGVRS